MIDTIVFIETNKSGSSRDALAAAQNLGYHTVLLTKRERYLKIQGEFPDVHKMIYLDLDDYDVIRENIAVLQKQEHNILCIVSFLDPYIDIAARLFSEFCNGNISLDAIQTMDDKIKTRSRLQGQSYSPFFHIIKKFTTLKTDKALFEDHYPLIVKSPKTNGSKDVTLVHSFRELKRSVEILKRKYSHQDVLVEEYLRGPQYLVEVIVHQGNIQIAAVVEQEITPQAPFIVTGYSVCCDMDTVFYKDLKEIIGSIVKGIGLINGTCHMELRDVNGKWKLVEINPRISGGAMNRMIEEAYGFSLVEQTIQLYCGNTPIVEKQFNHPIYVQ